MSTRLDHFIGGTSVPPRSGQYVESMDPKTGQVLGTVARGNAADVAAAVASVKAALPAWRDRRPIERGRILLEIARKIRERMSDLVAMEQAETGKPAMQAMGETEVSAQYFELYGGLVNAIGGETIDLGAAYHSYTRREPYGVVGVILPWNAPLNQAARAVAPALAAGNVVVAKPSEFTSSTCLELAKIAVECGLPAGVFDVVTGTGPEAGQAIVEHADVRKVAFTGSVRAGKEISKIAADRILPLTLELGGKSPNLVFPDADMEAAVAGSLRAFVINSGQVCSCGTRLLLERSIHDSFVTALARAADGVKPGKVLGPVTTEAQYRKVADYYAVAKEEGLRVAAGGELPKDESLRGGWYVAPTIYTGVTPDSRLAREEIFGPVVVVMPFGDEDEAVRIANDSPFGLVAGIWTRDLSRAHRVAAKLEAGQIFVNEWMAGGVETPFGGYKMSGYGREKGLEALAHYTQLKCVTIKL